VSVFSKQHNRKKLWVYMSANVSFCTKWQWPIRYNYLFSHWTSLVLLEKFKAVESDVLFFGSKIKHSKCDHYVRIYRIGKWGNSCKRNRMGFEKVR
jgi:hypothetical protein